MRPGHPPIAGGATQFGQGIAAFLCSNLLFFYVWFYNIGYGDGLKSLTSPGVIIFLVLLILFLIGTVAKLRLWLPALVGGAAGLGTAFLLSFLLIILGGIVAAGGL